MLEAQWPMAWMIWGGMLACAKAVAPPALMEWPLTSDRKCCCKQHINQPWVGTVPLACNHSWGWKGKSLSWDCRYFQKGPLRSSPAEFHCRSTLLPSKNLSAWWPGRKKVKPSGSNLTESCLVTFQKSCSAFLSGQTNSPRCMRAWNPTKRMTKKSRLSWLLEDMYWGWRLASSTHDRGHFQVVGMVWSFLQPCKVLVMSWWWWFFQTLGWNDSSSLQIPDRYESTKLSLMWCAM